MRRHTYKSIRNKLLATMILLPLLPFLLSLGIGYFSYKDSLEKNAVQGLSSTATEHRRQIELFLEERIRDLEFLALSGSYEELSDQAFLEELLQRLQRVTPAFTDLGIFNREGLHLAYAGPFALAGRVYYSESWFQEVLKKGTYTSDVFLGFRNVPHFVIAVAGGQDAPFVLRATIDADLFTSLVETVHIGETGEAYVVDARGRYQTRPRSGGRLMGEDPMFDAFSGSDGLNSFLLGSSDGRKYLYVTDGLQDRQWKRVVRLDEEEAFAGLYGAARTIVLVALLGGGILVAVAMLLTGRIDHLMQLRDREKAQLEGQLVRAARLAELGEMATGFAHEINNPLQIMKSDHAYVSMLLDDLQKRGEVREGEELGEIRNSLRQIMIQIGRCARITQSVLRFGRMGEPSISEVRLDRFIPEVADMVRKKAEVHGVTIHEECASDTPPVRCDAGQLQQVLLNLFNNALHAVTERHGAGGGRIDLKCGVDEEGRVEVRVADNGIGISPENLKKIFTPFFTTKPVGKGTGLGLSVCYGIVDGMGGNLDVSSRKGEGTTFTLTLPVSGDHADPAAMRNSTENNAA